MPETDKSLVISKVELLLSEKMASLAMLRTGIAVFTLPFSVLTVLIATSNYYEFSRVGLLLTMVFSLCAILAIIGGYMVFRSLKRIHILDQKIEHIKEHYKFMNHLLVE